MHYSHGYIQSVAFSLGCIKNTQSNQLNGWIQPVEFNHHLKHLTPFICDHSLWWFCDDQWGPHQQIDCLPSLLSILACCLNWYFYILLVVKLSQHILQDPELVRWDAQSYHNPVVILCPQNCWHKCVVLSDYSRHMLMIAAVCLHDHRYPSRILVHQFEPSLFGNGDKYSESESVSPAALAWHR